MVQFLITIHTIISILLIVVVLMQSGQGGLNSMMSGTANSMLGSSGANDFITKLTTGFRYCIYWFSNAYRCFKWRV